MITVKQSMKEFLDCLSLENGNDSCKDMSVTIIVCCVQSQQSADLISLFQNLSDEKTFFSIMADFRLDITAGALMQLMMNVGSMFSYSLGPYVSYTTLGVLSAIFPVLYVVLMLVMPETPYFLLMQGRRDEAETTLMRLRGQDNRQDIQVRLVVSGGCSEGSFHLGYQAARVQWCINYLTDKVSEKSPAI